MSALRRVEIAVTPTITSGSAYAAGNALGGLLTFGVPGMGDRMILDKVRILDKSNQKAATDLLLFGSTFTATADKSAINISAADAANLCGHINIVAGDYATISTAGSGLAVATHTFSGGGVGLITADPNMKLYGQLVTRGTPTYNSTTDIIVLLSLQIWIE